MYLAHRLLTLGHEYSNRFPVVLRSSTTTFVDQVTKLRELGTSMFLKCMQAQRNQIINILRESGTYSIYMAYVLFHLYSRVINAYLIKNVKKKGRVGLLPDLHL